MHTKFLMQLELFYDNKVVIFVLLHVRGEGTNANNFMGTKKTTKISIRYNRLVGTFLLIFNVQYFLAKFCIFSNKLKKIGNYINGILWKM